MEYTVILNPTARHGRALRYRAAIEAAFAQRGLTARIQRTDRPGHATELAREAACAGSAVVAVGGDGTVHEVAAGLIASGTAQPMGVIPIGTGNDFAKAAGLPGDLDGAVEVLAGARPLAIDYGVFRAETGAGAYDGGFVNAVGAGVDAAVARAAERLKWMPGPVGYAAALVHVLGRWTWPAARILIETGPGAYEKAYEGPLLLVSIGNGVRSGGLFFLTPEASLVDGQFDVCAIERLAFHKIIRYFPRVLQGTLQGVEGVHLCRGYGARIECADGLPVHADGEPIDQSVVRLDIAIRPGALRVLVPPASEQRTH